jgi:hypothetical protein
LHALLNCRSLLDGGIQHEERKHLEHGIKYGLMGLFRDVRWNDRDEQIAAKDSQLRRTLSQFCSIAWFGTVWADPRSNPFRELFTAQLASGKSDNDALLFINSGNELLPVEDQEHFHRQVTDSLVAIEERMVAYQREPKSRSLCRQAWI